jgi:hypothetical protein
VQRHRNGIEVGVEQIAVEPQRHNAVGVTSDSIRRHAERHFPVQNAARATYREILERRAKANSVDFVNGRPQPRRSLAQNIPANQRQKHRGASAVSRSWCV